MVELDSHTALVRRGFVPSEREVEDGAGYSNNTGLPNSTAADYSVPATAFADPVDEVVDKQRLLASIRELSPRRLGASPLPLLVFSVLGLLATWDAAGFNVLSADVTRTFHEGTGFVIALGTILGVVTTLLNPLAGFLADRFNRVWMLGIGNLISAAAQIVAGRAPSVAVMAGARAGGGVGQSITQPAVLPLITDYYPVAARARAMSFFFVCFGLGEVVGPVVSGQLGSAFGWRTTIVALGVASLAAALSIFVLRDPPRGAQDRLAQGAPEEAAKVEQRPVSWGEGWRAAASIASLRRLWYMTPFLVCATTFLTPLFSLYYATEFNVGSSGRGWIFGLQGVFGLLGLTMSTAVADKVLASRPGRVFTMAGALLAFNAIAMVALVLSPWLWLSIVILLPTQAMGFLVLPTLLTLVSLVVPPRIRAFGLQTTAPWSLMGFVGVQLIFLSAPNLGIIGSLLMMSAIFAVGSVVVAAGAPGVARDMRAARAASLADDVVRTAREEGEERVLVVRDVDVTYDAAQVLFNVDLDLRRGELVALLGTNGAGKSTLLRAICGVQEASNGAIFYDGYDVTHRPPHLNARDGIVYMPGGQAIFPSLTVEQNLHASTWADDDPAQVRDRLEQVLSMFPELRDRLNTPAGHLSGGEQQMVALGQVFLMRPRLLLIDELSLGLAPAVVERLLDIVRQINADGTTVLLVEQSANVALTVAQRAVFMDKGEIRFDGPTEELLGRSDLLRAVFLGGTGASASGFVASRRNNETSADEGPALAVEGLVAAFGGRRVLDELSLSVDPAEVLGIIGPNGAGKTTLFDVVSGYLKPESGKVFIGGHDCSGLTPDARARLGLARSFQQARLFGSLTVREAIAVALERRLAVRSAVAAALWLPNVRRAERRIQRRVDYLIDLMHLDAYADKFVRELSTGSRRMVDIAAIMAIEPKVLLLDEPSSGLAQSEVELLGPVIRRLAKETGCGVVVIEHDIPLVSALSDRMIALRLGSVLAGGTPAEVVGHPDVVHAYLGASESAIARSGPLLASALATALAASRLDQPV